MKDKSNTEKRILTDEERAAAKRARDLATLRASIELLRECRQKVMDNPLIDDEKRTESVKTIDSAIDQNLQAAEARYGASEEEVLGSEYKAPSAQAVEAYYRKLKKANLDPQSVASKGSAEVTASLRQSTGKDGKPRRKTRIPRKEQKEIVARRQQMLDEIQRVDDEESLMKSNRLNDDTDMARLEKEQISKAESKRAKEIGTADEKRVEKAFEKEAADKLISIADETPASDSIAPGKYTDAEQEYDFDASSVPPNVQFDILPLPSRGYPYPHKKGKIAVRYLTASDENIIASPNMYRDGKILDVILDRCILDKDFKATELCRGDRDAIILWLRATAYGTEFPVVVRNPATGAEHSVTLHLDQFKYNKFDLKGDSDGLFLYRTFNGDEIKFRFLTASDERKLAEAVYAASAINAVGSIRRHVDIIREYMGDIVDIEGGLKDDMDGYLDDLLDCLEDIEIKCITEDMKSLTDIATGSLLRHVVSVNGETARDYIKSYVSNMRIGEAKRFREFITANRPGIDFSFEVKVPQEEGGGSFNAVFRVNDAIFLDLIHQI